MSSISLQSSFFLTLKVIVHSLTSVEVKKREEKAKWVFFSFKGSLPARKIEVGPLLPPIIEILDAPLVPSRKQWVPADHQRKHCG